MTEPTTDLRDRLAQELHLHCPTRPYGAPCRCEALAAAVLPVVHAELAALRLRAEQAEVARDTHAHLLEHWADEHIILKTVSGPNVHATWCYRCRIERAENAAQRSREALARFDGRGLSTPEGTNWDIPTPGEVLDAWRASLDQPDPTRTPPPA